MAWLEKNRPNGPFQLVVRYGTQRLKRSTRTSDAPRANEIALRVDRRLEMLERGELTLPDDVDLLTFLMSDGCDWLTGQTIALDGAGHLANHGGFAALSAWGDAEWQQARDLIKAQNAKDKAAR